MKKGDRPMKVSEEFKKEATATHIGLVLAVVVILTVIIIAVGNGEIKGLVFLPLLGFFLVILVVCHLGDKETYREIQEEETKEEIERQKQLSK